MLHLFLECLANNRPLTEQQVAELIFTPTIESLACYGDISNKMREKGVSSFCWTIQKSNNNGTHTHCFAEPVDGQQIRQALENAGYSVFPAD